MKNPFLEIPGIIVLKNESLSRHSSFHIGGVAKYFIKIYSKKALCRVLSRISTVRMKFCVLGAGTNVLFHDKGFNGVVLQLHGYFKKVTNNHGYFTCGSGVLIDVFLRHARMCGYGGAEYLAGIPGTIGGAIKGNAGAYGKAMGDIIHSIRILTQTGKEQVFTCNDIGFGYRTSRLKNTVTIVAAILRLRRRKRSVVRKRIKEYLAHRRSRQPGGYSAGSFFKNPLPYSAGKLIDECGLKGLRVGDAEVSLLHGNWIINHGRAKAQDVLKLARKIKEKVRREKGILLQEEVRILR